MAPSAPPGALRALRGAWHLVGADPVRVLGASALALLADVGLACTAARLAWHLPSGRALLGVAVAVGVRCLVVSACEATVLALGAGRRPGPLLWLGALLLEAVSVVLGAAAAALALLPFAGLLAAVAVQGLVPGALVAASLGVVAAWLGTVLPRAALAPALPHLAAGHGIGAALRSLGSGFSFSARVLVLGDLLRVLGALALAAGALPAWPLPRLAWLVRLQTTLPPGTTA